METERNAAYGLHSRGDQNMEYMNGGGMQNIQNMASNL